ncbi:MAG: Coq4 family protein [Novosphingobium sp.]
MTHAANASQFDDARAAARAATPVLVPGRPQIRYDLPRAWKHFRELIRNKEDTTQVFQVFEALPWKGIYKEATAFLESAEGHALFMAEHYLPALLDDHEALRRMPAGSLAHAYCDFMESEGLSAQGLVDEYDKFRSDRVPLEDRFEWYFERMRDTHDLMHVLTGYGRDALGELCVLAFTYGQQPSPAHLFLGYAGGIEIRTRLKSKAPVLGAVREGQRLGKACPRLVEQPILDLLPLPIEEVRRRLRITPASKYAQCHAEWRKIGIDPYDMIAPVAEAA